MGVVGAALRGFGKALSKKSGTIKSVPIAKNLTKRRADFEDIVHHVNKHGKSPGSSKIKRDAAKKVSNIHTKYEKASSEVKQYNKRLKMKVIGGGGVAGAGVLGAHAAAKHKFPKYKKFAESDIKTVDGKLKLVPKKKK